MKAARLYSVTFTKLLLVFVASSIACNAQDDALLKFDALNNRRLLLPLDRSNFDREDGSAKQLVSDSWCLFANFPVAVAPEAVAKIGRNKGIEFDVALWSLVEHPEMRVRHIFSRESLQTKEDGDYARIDCKLADSLWPKGGGGDESGIEESALDRCQILDLDQNFEGFKIYDIQIRELVTQIEFETSRSYYIELQSDRQNFLLLYDYETTGDELDHQRGTDYYRNLPRGRNLASEQNGQMKSAISLFFPVASRRHKVVASLRKCREVETLDAEKVRISAKSDSSLQSSHITGEAKEDMIYGRSEEEENDKKESDTEAGNGGDEKESGGESEAEDSVVSGQEEEEEVKRCCQMADCGSSNLCIETSSGRDCLCFDPKQLVAKTLRYVDFYLSSSTLAAESRSDNSKLKQQLWLLSILVMIIFAWLAVVTGALGALMFANLSSGPKLSSSAATLESKLESSN